MNVLKKLCLLLIAGSVLWSPEMISQGSFSLWDDGSNGLKVSQLLLAAWTVPVVLKMVQWKRSQRRDYPSFEPKLRYVALSGAWVSYAWLFSTATSWHTYSNYWVYGPTLSLTSWGYWIGNAAFGSAWGLSNLVLFSASEMQQATGKFRNHQIYMGMGQALVMSCLWFWSAKSTVNSGRKAF